jgi:hypothetical protein
MVIDIGVGFPEQHDCVLGDDIAEQPRSMERPLFTSIQPP